MSLSQISRNTKIKNKSAIFNLGFRPFFLGAGLHAVISILTWMFIYVFKFSVNTSPYSLFEWHAHEMIFGYTIAVITGFLLTAIMNWTNVKTINGNKLKLLFIFWLIPRIAFLFGMKFIIIAAIFDLLFFIFLIFSILFPILKVKQWKQIGIVSKVILLGIGNILFYTKYFSSFNNAAFYGIYLSLFSIVGLILTIGGRVMPGFIRSGIDYQINIKNPFYLTILTLTFFVSFTINFLASGNNLLSGFLTFMLFFITSYRLKCWHIKGIWKKPLLWSLFIAFVSIDLGFLLFTSHYFYGTSKYLAIHAFTYGGVGLATLSMMSRVSLGHTGRLISQPPYGTSLILICLTFGAIIRVVFPFFTNSNYLVFILISQILWILSFTGFVIIFGKMLFLHRVDGKAG